MKFPIKKRYKYSAFGFIISSELELPELIACEGQEDVCITFGEVPAIIENPIEVTPKYQISETEFLLTNKTADYHVKEGKSIVINVHEDADPVYLKAYLMAIVFGALLIQRGLIPIHGCAVVINGKAVIFTGTSGAGKSTLCSAFRKKSFEYMSDDITAISFNEEGIPVVHPSFPLQKISKETAKMLKISTDGLNYNKIEDKYVIVSEDLFRNEQVPLAAIFEIYKDDVRRVEKIEVTGTEKLRAIIDNIYYFAIRKRMGIDPEFFEKLTQLANAISFHYLVRPYKRKATKYQIKYVLEAVV